MMETNGNPLLESAPPKAAGRPANLPAKLSQGSCFLAPMRASIVVDYAWSTSPPTASFVEDVNSKYHLCYGSAFHFFGNLSRGFFVLQDYVALRP